MTISQQGRIRWAEVLDLPEQVGRPKYIKDENSISQDTENH